MKLLASILLLLSLVNIRSQETVLTLYTQQSCNNCRYTKYMLQSNGITFENKELEDKANAAEMLQRLKQAGYTQTIHLPVIFLNDTVLLYPQAEHKDSTLYFLLQEMVAHKSDYRSAVSGATGAKSGNDAVEHSTSGCQFETNSYYLIIANFTTRPEAEFFCNTLKSNDYPKAEIIFHQRFYRVSAMRIFPTENETELLQQARRQYRAAYLLKNEE